MRYFSKAMLVASAALCLNLSAYSQDISLKINNVTVKEAMETLKKSTGYSFVFSSSDIDTRKLVTVNVVNAPIEEIIDKILQGQNGISYEIQGKSIVVKKSVLSSSSKTQYKVSGKVIDQRGESVIGASVIEYGTSNGTVTDVNGNFELSVSNGAMLDVSYIGYKSQRVKVVKGKKINVTLVENTELLDEIVVVGYGSQKKVNLTGAVSSINFNEQALSRTMTNVSSALSGLSAGVSVSQTSGQPGSDGATIRIRGVGTLDNSDPLVIIDGMEGILDAVNPQDIESISILKDAASASIYGSRGANGVILVTTKKASVGKITVNYSGQFAFAQPTKLIDFVSDYADYMGFINESLVNVGQPEAYSQSTIDLWREKSKNPYDVNEYGVPNYVAYPNTDWSDWLFQNNLIQVHNLSFSGGTERLRGSFSVNYTDNPGIVETAGVKKYMFRFNIDADVTKWLTVGNNTWMSQEDQEMGSWGTANQYLIQTNPSIYPYWNGQYGVTEGPDENYIMNNPIATLHTADGNNRVSRINTTFFTKVKILKGLTWTFNYNYSRRIDERKTYAVSVDRYKLSNGVLTYPGFSLDELTSNFYHYGNENKTMEHLLNYDFSIKDHSFAILAGYNQNSYYDYSNSAAKKGFMEETLNVPSTVTNMTSITGGATERRIRSYFGRLNYNYKDRYLFEANIRYDGSSRFSEDVRWGAFPSFSAGWRLSEEHFMNATRGVVDNLKLRASYGKLGNNSIGDYEYQSGYSRVDYSFGGTQTLGLAQTTLGNSRLRWESTAILDVGLDGTFFDNRLSFTFDWYDKVTDGILYRPLIYATVGNKTAPRQNIAEVTNRGYEFTLGWNDRIKDLSYSVSVNWGYNKNCVSKYKGKLVEGWVEDEQGNREYKSNLGDVSNGGTERVVEGKMMNEYYLLTPYKGTGKYFDSEGNVDINGGPRDGMIRTEEDMEWLQAMFDAGYQFQPRNDIGRSQIWYGDYIYADNNGDGIYGNSYDNQFQNSSSQPKWTYGMQASLEWRGVDFSMSWAGAAGFDLYWSPATGYNSPTVQQGNAISKNVGYDHYFYDPNDPENPLNNITSKNGRLISTSSGMQNTAASTLYLYKGDYLKLKNLTVGYTFPKKWTNYANISKLRLYVSAENLLTITSFPWMDPEMSSRTGYPTLKQFTLGVNVTF